MDYTMEYYNTDYYNWFVSQTSCSMMNNYQQQQQRAMTCPPPGPPSLHSSPQVAGYQQYGSSQNLSTITTSETMISYPTTHMYQTQTGSMPPPPPPPPATPPSISDPVTKAVVDNILGKLPTKKNQVTHRCEVCDQEFSGRSVLDTHLAGAKHAKRIKSMEILNQLAASGQNFSQSGLGGNLRCEACGIDANSSQQLQTHLAGNKHKQRMAKLGGKMPPPATPPQTVSTLLPSQPAPAPTPQVTQDPSDPTTTTPTGQEGVQSESKHYICQLCNVTLNSSVQMQQHVESRKHKDRENPQHSNKHHPYRRVPQARFSGSKKKKQPLAFMTPLSSSFVPGSML